MDAILLALQLKIFLKMYMGYHILKITFIIYTILLFYFWHFRYYYLLCYNNYLNIYSLLIILILSLAHAIYHFLKILITEFETDDELKICLSRHISEKIEIIKVNDFDHIQNTAYISKKVF